MLQNDTLCIIFGLVSQKLQRSKHCILSMRHRIEKIVTVYVLFTVGSTIDKVLSLSVIISK